MLDLRMAHFANTLGSLYFCILGFVYKVCQGQRAFKDSGRLVTLVCVLLQKDGGDL